MKILLDENFPLALVRELRRHGRETEHIILLGLRGAPDSLIVDRLNSEDLLFLTQDQEFLSRPLTRSPAIVSRVTQALPIGILVDIWLRAIRDYFSRDWRERLFEVFDDGRLVPWKELSEPEGG
jgi:predicted nuclease of predicted toxin-antitoxin system